MAEDTQQQHTGDTRSAADTHAPAASAVRPPQPQPQASVASTAQPLVVQTERDQHLFSLRNERTRVQAQYDTVKGLQQYQAEQATLAVRLAELDTAIKEAEAAGAQQAEG